MATLNDIKEKIIYFVVNGEEPIPIHPIRVSNTRSKKLTKRTPTQSSQNWETGPKDTKIKDKLQIENVYEVDGWIDAIESGETDGSYFITAKTAYQVKKDFLDHVFNSNANPANFYMKYEGESIFGAVERVDISEECTDKTGTNSDKYSIKFIFVAVSNTVTS